MHVRRKLRKFFREGRAQGFATLLAIFILENLLDIETGADATMLQHVAHQGSVLLFAALERVRRF